jgi:phospholipid/cholesterol/gamma-HCH transport system substrate-binding protein
VKRSHSTELVVGLFVLFGVIAGIAVVLLLGQKRHVFQQRVQVHSVFTSVGGLVVGAPVHIAGVNVGTVAAVRFDRTQARPRIRVDMEITQDALDLVREDSIARISSQGLLGDKLVDLTPGTVTAPEVAPGGAVTAAPPSDIDNLMIHANRVMSRLETVADNAALLAEDLGSERGRADIRRSLTAIRLLLEATAHGEGLAHAIFYDRRTAKSLQGIAVGIDRLVERVNHTVAALQPIFEATDEEGRQIANNISRAAREVGRLAAQADRSRVIPNLENASENLSQVAHQLRVGEGTMGALIQDPTVYQQLVTILGGVERSRILRVLVRYAISKESKAATRKPEEVKR